MNHPGVGAAAGVALAALLTRFLAALLSGTGPTGPWVFAVRPTGLGKSPPRP